MTSTKMPMSRSRNQLRVWSLIGALLAVAVMVWLLVPSGSQSQQTSESKFQDITVTKPATNSAPSTCDGPDLTAVFTKEASETLQIDGLTFNRNAERAVVDVPATIKISAIIVGDVAVDVRGSTLGQYKTSYFLPYYSWGKVGVVTVCLV